VTIINHWHRQNAEIAVPYRGRHAQFDFEKWEQRQVLKIQNNYQASKSLQQKIR
jgi:hypothetical protein